MLPDYPGIIFAFRFWDIRNWQIAIREKEMAVKKNKQAIRKLKKARLDKEKVIKKLEKALRTNKTKMRIQAASKDRVRAIQLFEMAIELI